MLVRRVSINMALKALICVYCRFAMVFLLQVRNINVPNTRPPSGFQGKYEKRVIIENGVETVEEYENDRLVSRTVNGVPQQVS